MLCLDGDDEEPAAAPAAEAPPPTSGRKKQKLINQFNYCERAALTYNNPSRVTPECLRNRVQLLLINGFPPIQTVETQTIPPPRSSYGANVVQWVIYDWYADDFEQSQREKEKDKKVSFRFLIVVGGHFPFKLWLFCSMQ